MRILLPILAVLALAGLCREAGAQAPCPELRSLRSEAVEASKPTTRALMSDRCDAYIRASRAWSAVVDYANDHRDVCEISDRLLGEGALQDTTTAVQTRHHRADRDVEDLGSVLVGEVADVDQDEDVPEVVGDL